MQVRASLLLLCGLLMFAFGCPETEPQEQSPPRDLSAPDLSCVQSPRTHVELLNACTSAQSVDKRPLLPLLQADGTLPPLP